LREFLWNTLQQFPRYLPLNLWWKSLISSDLQRLTEIVFVVELQTLHEISTGKTLKENLNGELNASNIK